MSGCVHVGLDMGDCRTTACLTTMLAVALVVPALAQPPSTAQQAATPVEARTSPPTGKQQFLFRGTVEKVNAAGRTVDVKNDNVPGWMPPMSMTYHVDTPALLATLKSGDRITATVYKGDTSTLYRVRAVVPQKKPDNALPPISYVCPSPGEESFVDDKRGRCPKSGADLQAVRLDIAYKCLKNSYINDRPGICPVDRSDLVPVTASVFWLCKTDQDAGQHFLEPGTCRDGTQRQKAFEVRPHGDHNPRHGGPAVFMSEDLYHHVEATLVEPAKGQAALFRVYFYDEYTRPITATGVTALVAPTDKNGQQTGAPITLVVSRIGEGNAMEARLAKASVPNEGVPAFFALHVRFKSTDRDWLTDHAFTSYSKEPVRLRSAAGSAPVARVLPQSTSTATPPSPVVTPANSGPQVATVTLPDTAQDLLTELQRSMMSVTELWEKGDFGALWYPALRAKDIALKLQQDHVTEIQDTKRPELSSAVQRMTAAAWQIDSAGDLGNKQKIALFYDAFHAAVGDILSRYGAAH